jgi:radical SAM protein with 4Fe4S-binding SPASM domain
LESVVNFEGFPFEIGWEITLACNLRCHHCASSAGVPRPNELSTREALDICDQFPALLVQEVDFTGGEPILRKDWPEIALHLRDLKIPVSMLTNGLALESEHIDMMKDAGVHTIGISLDGLERTHDTIRSRKGSYSKVMECIRLLKESGLRFIVITTVNSLNVAELPAIYEILRPLGVRCWRVQPMIPSGRVRQFGNFSTESRWVYDLALFLREYKPRTRNGDLRIICGDGLEYLEDNIIKKPWRGCSAGLTACDIASDGKVIGCLSMPEHLYEGDLRKNTLWDIWFNPEAFAYNRRFSPEHLGSNCRACDKSQECRGGCSSCSYAATGQFHNNPFCYYRAINGETP